MNSTLTKFGYPTTCVAETVHWCVLARPQQVTLGALVLAAKSEVTSFRALSQDAFTDMQKATSLIENSLKRFRNYDKINYLMLMMVDPHVHMHVLPRYEKDQSFGDKVFRDAGWPAAPDLKSAHALTSVEFGAIVAALKQAFKGA
jgi:diadenosine tetraphosphate (Ap4A) HIT family hydrolase